MIGTTSGPQGSHWEPQAPRFDRIETSWGSLREGMLNPGVVGPGIVSIFR